jgi:nucleoside-diphosphate-sugar epimerase
VQAFPSVKWLQCDLADTDAVMALTARNRIDACIHAAAISNEAYARPDPRGAIATNVGATANLLEAARLASWRRFVLISTGSVFSLNSDTTRPILEDQAPGVANVYSTTKLCAELLTSMYRTEYGLSASTVRISWVFGPPIISDQPMRGPIPSYLLRALQASRSARAGQSSPRASPMWPMPPGVCSPRPPRRSCATRSIISAMASISPPGRRLPPSAARCRAR